MTGTDLISRQAAIRWVKQECNPYSKPTLDFESGKRVMEHLKRMPSAQPEVLAHGEGELSAQPERKYTLEEVAEILASVIGDECACNINGIDEWLPERCKYTEIGEECPNPKEKHGCWMQFLLQGGAKI